MLEVDGDHSSLPPDIPRKSISASVNFTVFFIYQLPFLFIYNSEDTVDLDHMRSHIIYKTHLLSYIVRIIHLSSTRAIYQRTYRHTTSHAIVRTYSDLVMTLKSVRTRSCEQQSLLRNSATWRRLGAHSHIYVVDPSPKICHLNNCQHFRTAPHGDDSMRTLSFSREHS